MALSENAVYGYDTVSIQSGNRMSLPERAGAFTVGAVTSAVASFYNTGVAVNNFFGGDAEEMDVQKKLSSMDRDWGTYYAENKDLIDTAGFVAGSFVPGAIGMKAMQLAKIGKYGGAVGRAVAGPLNFFAEKRALNLAKGLEDIASEGGTAFAFVNRNKLAAMGWETADKVLEVAAGELMIAATMKQSPLLADDGWGEVAKDLVFTSAIGGGLLGGVGAFSMNKLFKDTVKQADAIQRKYDTVDTFKALDVGVGDKVYGLVDSLLALPDKVLDSDKLLKVQSKFLGPKEVTLDLSGQLGATISRRDSGAFVKLQELFLDNKNVDKETGVAMGEFLVDIVRRGKAADVGSEKIKRVVGEYMLGLRSAHGLSDDVSKVFDDADVFYVNTKLPASANGVPDLTKALSRIPQEGGHIQQPYRIVGDIKQAQTMMVGAERPIKKLQDAWDAGADIAVLPDNTMRVNPKSQIIKQMSDDPAFSGIRYLNTRTGAVTEEAVVTAADVTKDFTNKITKRGVVTDVRAYNFSVDTWYEDIGEITATEATARHAWFAKMGDELLGKKAVTINGNDISALSFIKQTPDGLSKYKHVAVDFGGDDIRTIEEIGQQLPQLLDDIKAEQAMLLFSQEGADVRTIAYKLNMSEDALAAMVETEFKNFRSKQLAQRTDGLDLPLGLHLKRENIAVKYDVADALPSFAEGVDPAQLSALQKAKGIKPDFIDGEVGWSQRVAMAEERLRTAFHTVVPENLASQFQDIDHAALIKQANQEGAGASTLGMANADYSETAKLFYQNTGKLTHRLRETYVEEALGTLRPHMHKLQQNQAAAAELGILDYAMRASDEQYTLWRETTPGGVGKNYLVPVRAVDFNKMTLDKKIIAELENAGKKGQYEIKHNEVADFIEQWVNTNGDRVSRRTQLLNARGYTSSINPKAFYVPPIDTARFKHFAFVREVDGALGSTSEVTMVVAKDAKELQQKVAQIPSSKYEVFYKQDTEDYFKVKGQYDQQQTLNSPRINSDLRRMGVLTDFMPSTRPENVLADYMNFTNSSWSNLAREAVETRYGQLFEQLRFLGRNYTEAATSQFSGNIAQAKLEAIDPFADGIRTALDISKKSQYKLLAEANEFVDALGTRAYRAIANATDAAAKGTIKWEEAAKLAQQHGVGGVFNIDNVAEAYRLSNAPYDRNLFRETISKVNTILANTVLRLDAANSVLNAISTTLTTGTELAALRTMFKNDPQMAAMLADATSVAIPGKPGAAMPSTTKLIINAAKNYFTDEGKALRKVYYDAGDIKNVKSMYHQMMDDLALPNILDNGALADISRKADAFVEVGAKYTGNAFSEEFTRFISANIMDQLTAPAVQKGLMTKQEAAAWRSVFVNRTQGNYITSQRPIIFQGTTGAAIGLFQTYAFTLMQQLARHISNKDSRALLTFGGLQTALFGLNGLPFFEAVNTHIIGNASTNDSHSDVYSTVTKALGKDMGDWLMYGTASAFPLFTDKMPALYTRGDVNPRHLTVIPVLPTQMPFFDASVRVASNLWDTAGMLAKGGNVKNTLLEGLEHNGISRPLAGLAQAANGYTTTGKGGLISANADLFSIANASRLLGAKPVDEAVALNTLYRQKAYQAKDAARLEFLGQTIKTQLRENAAPSEEDMQDFLAAYTSVGGRAENYSRAMQRWQRDANISVINQITHFHNTPYANRMLEIMEGGALEDFSFNPAPTEQGAGLQQPMQ